jgi:ABC-2 type transport system permease protein
MRASRVLAIALRQAYLLRNSATRVLPLFAWVAVDILTWGFFSRYLDRVAQPGMDFVPALLGAVLLWDFLTRVMQGVTMAFFEDVWSRNFLNLFATPLTVSDYVAGLVLTAVATSLVGLVAMLVLATAVFGLSLFAYGAAAIPFLLVLFLFGLALGILGAGMVLRLGPASEWFVWPIPAILSPFAAVFYPVSALPGWMQAISRLLPPSYVFEGLRGIVRGEGVAAGTLALGVVLALLYVAAAWLFFRHVHRYALRSGLIARYSAESVS